MPKRSRREQTRHDQKVEQLARQLKRQGWDVDADIAGYEQPDPIGRGGRIPDIRATKAGAERIIEVETAETLETDKKQQETFRRSASQKPRTTFRIEEA